MGIAVVALCNNMSRNNFLAIATTQLGHFGHNFGVVCMEKNKKMKKKNVWDLDEAELKGKRALVQANFNVPLDNKCIIIDDIQIQTTVSTIKYLMEKGAKVILSNHLVPIKSFQALVKSHGLLLKAIILLLGVVLLEFSSFQFCCCFVARVRILPSYQFESSSSSFSCVGSTQRHDLQVLLDSFGATTFKASWCGIIVFTKGQ